MRVGLKRGVGGVDIVGVVVGRLGGGLKRRREARVHGFRGCDRGVGWWAYACFIDKTAVRGTELTDERLK